MVKVKELMHLMPTCCDTVLYKIKVVHVLKTIGEPVKILKSQNKYL